MPNIPPARLPVAPYGHEEAAYLLLRGARKGIVFAPAYQGEFDEADQPPER